MSQHLRLPVLSASGLSISSAHHQCSNEVQRIGNSSSTRAFVLDCTIYPEGQQCCLEIRHHLYDVHLPHTCASLVVISSVFQAGPF